MNVYRGELVESGRNLREREAGVVALLPTRTCSAVEGSRPAGSLVAPASSSAPPDILQLCTPDEPRETLLMYPNRSYLYVSKQKQVGRPNRNTPDERVLVAFPIVGKKKDYSNIPI